MDQGSRWGFNCEFREEGLEIVLLWPDKRHRESLVVAVYGSTTATTTIHRQKDGDRRLTKAGDA